ncbi:cyclin-domain-containing protein [Rhizodiscina lignyota]|uniref:Cyclin-domain-containing protein n=1 Tax=Rhizodiscina lignyota TaxID=1504668 RepID=A0A9P4IG31_9PEZI|nr:cyclin-domain-containing protein [Rhizodiscina lignyota]
MFGAGAHHAPQESQSAQMQQRSASIRSSHADASAFPPRSSQPQAPVDTPMTDAISRSSSGSGFSSHSQQYATSVRSSTSNAVPPALQHLQGSISRPPPSPRFRGHPSSQHQTPTSGPNQPHFPYPPSAVSSASSAHPSPSQSVQSLVPPAPPSPNRIKVRSLSHIQSFANDESSPLSQARSGRARNRRDANEVGPQYEISEMPVTDIIEMVAGLLTKITSTNDRQHEHIHRQIPPPEGTAGLSQQTNSVLAFHGKNVPQISILSYLSRIHKYCPTTYEVFLSLLVYFDRMTEMVNSGPMQNMRHHSAQTSHSRDRAGSETTLVEDTNMGAHSQPPTPTPPPSGSLGKPAETGKSAGQEPPSPPEATPMDVDSYNLSHFFVVDSYNIHRLVIAGVTCASKFFSDIFYTNSRYAKVGGLPLPELNHLELQFLLLNDFRLSIPLEEIQAYGTMLVEFYAREVVAQQESVRR